MTKVAKITIKEDGTVSVTFTLVSSTPTGPLTLPEEVIVQTVPREQALEIVRQWLGL